MYESPIYKALVGKTIIDYVISKDRGSITFTLQDAEPVILDAFGDCCSSTWIESIDMDAALKGGVVGTVEDINMPNLGDIATEHCEYPDSIAYYGLKIITNKGHSIIDYRNNSNGYYGGSLEVRGEGRY